jgi:hypothetical protein
LGFHFCVKLGDQIHDWKGQSVIQCGRCAFTVLGKTKGFAYAFAAIFITVVIFEATSCGCCLRWATPFDDPIQLVDDQPLLLDGI